MTMRQPAEPQNMKQPGEPVMTAVAGSLRYWEPRRVVYNAVLVVVVIGWIVGTWPHFRSSLTVENLLRMCVLGLIANVLYCAAYFVDLPMQATGMGAIWKRMRAGLWVLGTVLAVILTNYWIADEIYPYVN